jgi:hypothetical protein
MRAPQRRRPRKRRVGPVPPFVDLARIAAKARYVGSPEHKDAPGYVGQPKLRSDASVCPRHLSLDPSAPQGWLEQAIRLGAVGHPWEGSFPRYVWYQEEGTVFEGRLVNRELGEYKGYPLEPEEWPPGIEAVYDTP